MQFVERLPHKDSDLLRIRHDVVVGNIIFFSVVERGSLLGSIHFCCCGDGGGAAADAKAEAEEAGAGGAPAAAAPEPAKRPRRQR